MSRKKYKILIVDDEPPARELIKNYLSEQNDIKIIGECQDGFEAAKAIQEEKPDIVVLDIQMPKITGFELLDLINEGPEIIFATAYDDYAIKAFEKNAIDYLLKPFSKSRLLKALEKAKQKLSEQPRPEDSIKKMQDHLDKEDISLERIVVKFGSKIIIIPVDEIRYIEAQNDYVMIHSEKGKHLKEKTMKYLETHLPENRFIRIHRSYIVNIEYIASVELYAKDTHLVMMKSGEKIRASQEGYKRLRKFFT